MKVFGIVAEYNPFHNGHKYHIEKTLQSGATHIVAVMSPNVVQRGSVAVFDKHFRARKACENGANLVVELPCPFSCACSEIFAGTAMGILKGLGVVDGISFGCEAQEDVSEEPSEFLKNAAAAVSQLENSQRVKELCAQGMSYPAAVSTACRELYGDKTARAVSTPNNTLAIEYIKAAKRIGWDADLIAVARKGAAHDGAFHSFGIASASLVRERILSDKDYAEFVPYEISQEAFDLERMTNAAVFKFRSMSFEEICEIPDCTKELAVRITQYLKSENPRTLSEFYDALKTKNITHARIRRVILQGLLGIKKEDFEITPYARVLAADDKGMEILKALKGRAEIPVSHSLSLLSRQSDGAKRLAQLDVLSSQLQKMCGRGEISYPNEFSVKFFKT